MNSFTARFVVRPAAPFGLPDGAKVVVPVDPEGMRHFHSDALDTRTGRIVSYGTLSLYRAESDALHLVEESADPKVSIVDNFLKIRLESNDPDSAVVDATIFADRLCRALSMQQRIRMSAEFLDLMDDEDQPVKVRRLGPVTRFEFTVYNVTELRERLERSIAIARSADAVTSKALLYFDHAQMVALEADRLPFGSAHESFYRALAFLQLYKGLTLVLGEPGTDRDYQRRFKQLGLPGDFWNSRVKPLYDVRNDDDVAHYSRAFPEAGAFRERFDQAASVLWDALRAWSANGSGV